MIKVGKYLCIKEKVFWADDINNSYRAFIKGKFYEVIEIHKDVTHWVEKGVYVIGEEGHKCYYTEEDFRDYFRDIRKEKLKRLSL